MNKGMPLLLPHRRLLAGTSHSARVILSGW